MAEDTVAVVVVNMGDVIVTGAVVCEAVVVVSGTVVVVTDVVSEAGGTRLTEGIEELSVKDGVVVTVVVTVVAAVVPVTVPEEVTDVSGGSPVTVNDVKTTFILPITRPQGIFCALSQSRVYFSPPQLPP